MESYTKTVEEALQDVQSSKQGSSKQKASLHLKKEGLNQLQSAKKTFVITSYVKIKFRCHWYLCLYLCIFIY